MKKVFLSTILFLSLVLILFFGNSGCANIIPPSGGPADTLPPVLLNVSPKDSTVNFTGRRIVLNFDEYIELEDVQNNLLFTPLFENVPVIEQKLKTITVRIRDSLEPNTTYTFNFGNAIRDINEGNPLGQFTYVFSTGPYIDSLRISGRVVLSENGKVDSTLQVVLHTDFTDSAVAKMRPRYAARLDSSGRFTFRNLPPGNFAIYALGEAGTMRRYTSPDQVFAFADAPVISGNTDSLVLYAYKEEEKKQTTARTAQTQRTGNTPQERRLRFTDNLSNGMQDLLTDFTLRFELPLRNLDTTKIRFTTDTTFVPATDYRISQDSTGKELHLATPWKEGTVYNLILDKDFAEDSTGRKLLRTDTVTFSTRKRSDYGQVRVRLRNLDSARNPVLQFVQNDKVVFAASVKGGLFTRQLFMPGEYELRILYDRNNNGKWDAGKFFEGRLQPELVRPLNYTFVIKAGRENDSDMPAPAD